MRVGFTSQMSMVRRFIVTVSVLLPLGLSAPSAKAGNLPRVATLPLSLAIKAANASLKKCAGDGYLVSVAVVDRAGVLKVLLRADGAGPHTPDSSRKKAYTSASLRRATSVFAALIAKQPAVQGLRDMNENILMLGGGLPITMDAEVVGGIGVGGAPGGQLDEACAQAGLNSIGATPGS